MLPNFATEIYTVMALTAVARNDLDLASRNEAIRLADALLEMQRPDGGWPWLFNAARGTVVEPYEVYSVHQDAMAPMALLALTDLTGDERYAGAARRGLRWGFGHNELSVNFYDAAHHFAHRSIRRAAPWTASPSGRTAPRLGWPASGCSATADASSSTTPAGRITSVGSSKPGRPVPVTGPRHDAPRDPSVTGPDVRHRRRRTHDVGVGSGRS